MGILSDFVVADRAESGAVADAADRAQWPCLQSGGFTILEVGYLHFVLTGQDPNAPTNPPKVAKNPYTGEEYTRSVGTEYLDAFHCHEDRGESWVHELPASLISELAAATDLDAAAAQWAAFEELGGTSPQDLKGVLVALQRLAQLAQQQQQAVLLWTSL